MCPHRDTLAKQGNTGIGLEASAKDGSQLGSRARSLQNKVNNDGEAMLKMHSKVPSLRGG